MNSKTKYVLGDDIPKQNPWREDRLGYAPFAKRISSIIINLTAPNGYVIGLHGQWGSGKSTILNFILEYIKKHNTEHEDDQVIHIDFRPWIVSGHHDLIAAFFKILSENLGPKESRWIRFRRWISRLVSGTTDNLVDAAATVALTVDPSGGVASGFAGSLTKKSVNALLGRFLENPSLQKAYDDLKIQLGRSGKRFLVTIDDIDRLEDTEVRAIMQMVKSIGRLPNVVYLLAYDREIVWQTMDQVANRAGPRFAEKLVQQEIELPKPTQGALLAILDQEVSFLTGSSDDSTRWQYLVRDGIHRWIRSPRDVVRLSNAAKFSWPALENEIDPQDLLAIEGVRLFDGGAFSWTRDNRDFLFGQGRFLFSGDEEKKSAAEDLKKRIPEGSRPQVIHVMSVLFPQAAKWFEDRQTSGEAPIEVSKRRGVGSEAGYDAYFGMHPSSDHIPKAVLNELMSQLENVDRIEAIIRSYFGKKNSRGELMIAKLLDELRLTYRGNRPALPTQALLDALFRVGEHIFSIDWDGDPFVLSPRSQIIFLIRNMLEQWDSDEAGDRLIDAFDKGTSPAFLASIYVDRGRELGVFKSYSSESASIGKDDFKKLGEILIQKIQAAANNQTLENAPFFFDIMRSWAQLQNPSVVKAWLKAGIEESPEFMAKVCRGLVGYSVDARERYYTMRENPEPEFYDLRVLLDGGKKHLRSTKLTTDQRKLITEVVRGAEQLLKAQTSVGEKDSDE